MKENKMNHTRGIDNSRSNQKMEDITCVKVKFTKLNYSLQRVRIICTLYQYFI